MHDSELAHKAGFDYASGDSSVDPLRFIGSRLESFFYRGIREASVKTADPLPPLPGGGMGGPPGEPPKPPVGPPKPSPGLPPEPPNAPPKPPTPQLESSPLKPRIPEGPKPPEMGEPSGVPTDVVVDAETGAISISKGKVNLKIAEVKDPYDKPFGELISGHDLTVEETPLADDTHDDPFALPANRRKPPVFDVVVDVPEGQDPKALAYTLEIYANAEVEVGENKITIKDVPLPIGTVTELRFCGYDAHVDGKNLPDLYKGMKVAVLKDIPDLNYYPNHSVRPFEAILTAYDKVTEEFIMDAPILGTVRARKGEFERVSS